jgi:hypothetical protein
MKAELLQATDVLACEDEEKQRIEAALVRAGGAITKDEQIRHTIVQLEDNIRTFKQAHGIPDPECPLTHTFAPGAYARTIFIPKDTLVVGKIHKHAHLNMLMVGRVLVATEEGPVTYEAPRVMVSKSGTKRVVYTCTDTIWTTVHVTEKTDIEEIEDDIIAKDYASLDAMQDTGVLQIMQQIREEIAP